MRFTSLVVELIRARPRLVVWLVVLLQAALWLILPMLLYRSPPGDLATVLAFGREYQVGTWSRSAAGVLARRHRLSRRRQSHVRRLSAGAALRRRRRSGRFYQLARAIVGGQQAVLAVLLSMTVVAFSSPGVEFGPLVLARPLWALLLLHSWQLIGQNRRNAWFAWSIEAGLLLLTTSAAIGLLLLVAGFAVATERGRRTLMSFDPLFALLVIVVLALPYLIWLIRADALAMPPWPAISDLGARAMHWGWLLGGLVLAMSGIVLLVVLNSGWFARNAEEAPIIYRPPVDPLARNFVYFFAIAPALRRKPDRGPVQSRSRRRRRRRRAADVGTCRDRRDRRSDPSAAPAPAALGLGGGDRRARLGGDRDHVVSALDRQRRGADLAAGDGDRAFLRRQFRAAHQPAAARGGRRSAAGEPHRAGAAAVRICCSTPRRSGRRGCRWRNSTRPAASWSGAPPTPSARRRPISRSDFPAWCRKCRARSNGW